MQKEKMTIRDIRYDLLRLIKGGTIGFLCCFILFLLFLPVSIGVFDERGSIITKLYIALIPLPFLIGIIIYAVHLYRFIKSFRRPYVIVDRLVGMEIKDHIEYKFRRCYQTYHLYFASYGEYQISRLSYRWSDLHSMTDDMIYFHSECGDEFYLVLSKPHIGKIMVAYNRNMFEFQE